MCFGYFPVIYVIRKKAPEKWWLKNHDENTGTCTWTSKSLRAQHFTSKDKCEEYITKYLSNRDVKIDERMLHPFAYA